MNDPKEKWKSLKIIIIFLTIDLNHFATDNYNNFLLPSDVFISLIKIPKYEIFIRGILNNEYKYAAWFHLNKFVIKTFNFGIQKMSFVEYLYFNILLYVDASHNDLWIWLVSISFNYKSWIL